MPRKPIVAGQFYESHFNGLNKQIEDCFYHKLGPGDLPTKRKDKRLYGIISPHAGYIYSGPAQAWAYKEIAESKFPETFIVIGTNHTGYGHDFSISTENWETPLGIVKVNKLLGKAITEKCDFVKDDNSAHRFEHSIEVQLPFLQYVNKDKLKQIRILPINILRYGYEECKRLGETIAKLDKNIVVIASSDFTHYGPNYGYAPFKRNIKENLYELDGKAIDFILNLNSQGFLKYKQEKGATICGAGAIAVLIETVKTLGAKKGNLLNYYTSGDIVKNYSNAVGYAAISF